MEYSGPPPTYEEVVVKGSKFPPVLQTISSKVVLEEKPTFSRSVWTLELKICFRFLIASGVPCPRNLKIDLKGKFCRSNEISIEIDQSFEDGKSLSELSIRDLPTYQEALTIMKAAENEPFPLVQP